MLWVSLLEKAWAKLCGNYERIISGAVDLGFMHLAGVPALNLKHEELRSARDFVWQSLKRAQFNNHIVLAGTSDNNAQGESQRANGLISNHCYSVLRVFDLKSGGKMTRVLKLRNPHGKQSWTGLWSENSAIWTPELRAEVGPFSGSQGTFCISLEDFLQNLSNTYICKYDDDDKFTKIVRKTQAERSVYEFELKDDFIYDQWSLEILVNQLGDRISRRKRQDGSQFDPSWFEIMLCRQGNEQASQTSCSLDYFFVKSSVSSNYQVNLSVEKELLKPGKYFLMVEAMWNKIALS